VALPAKLITVRMNHPSLNPASAVAICGERWTAAAGKGLEQIVDFRKWLAGPHPIRRLEVRPNWLSIFQGVRRASGIRIAPFFNPGFFADMPTYLRHLMIARSMAHSGSFHCQLASGRSRLKTHAAIGSMIIAGFCCRPPCQIQRDSCGGQRELRPGNGTEITPTVTEWPRSLPSVGH